MKNYTNVKKKTQKVKEIFSMVIQSIIKIKQFDVNKINIINIICHNLK